MRVYNDLLTFESVIVAYYQFWMPGLGDADERKEPKFKLEYLTYTLPSLQLGNEHDEGGEEVRGKIDIVNKKGKEKWYPVPLKELPKSLVKGKKKSEKYLPFNMEDLTIGSWMKMAVRLGERKENKLRKRFKKYMYMGGEEQ